MIARRRVSGFARVAFGVALRRRRVVGLFTLILWILAVGFAYAAHAAQPTTLHGLLLILLLALFVVVHVQATVTAWAVSRDWRRMLALLYSARYLSEVKGLPGREAFLVQLCAEMQASRDGGPACTLVTVRFASLDTIRESFGDQYAHKAVVQLGDRLKRVTRGADLLGYIGEGTFATLLVDCDAAEAQQFVRRVPAALPLQTPAKHSREFALQVLTCQYDGETEDPADFLAHADWSLTSMARLSAQRSSLAESA